MPQLPLQRFATFLTARDHSVTFAKNSWHYHGINIAPASLGQETFSPNRLSKEKFVYEDTLINWSFYLHAMLHWFFGIREAIRQYNLERARDAQD
ncbi:MAG: hypothetical protein ACO0C9_08055 [Candidatus Methanosuratincola verstraetei]|jgi:hypothetical protein